MADVSRSCSMCKKKLPEAAFDRLNKFPFTFSKYCRGCRKVNNEAVKKYHRLHPNSKKGRKDKILQLRGHLRRKFGITLEEYNKLSEAQNNCCIVCGSTSSRNKYTERLAVDHDHKTGKIRGLLCHKCNLILGLCDDNLIVLKNLINYLSKGNEIECRGQSNYKC